MSWHQYLPHTPEDIAAMLERCGVSSVEDLYADVPEELRIRGRYELPEGISEKEIRDFFAEAEAECRDLTCFAGAGVYHHYVPAVIPSLLSRSEYLTAYTPYQPEISQGTLQYIFEYQTMMASLTGLEVSNASMYDGTTATAEAMLMAVAASRKRNRMLISATVNPSVRRVVATYARYHKVRLDVIPATDGGVTDRTALSAMLADGDVAGVIVATPNYYGIVEDYTGLAEEIHTAKSLMIVNCNPSVLAVVRTPGEWGADIAAGDAQSLGMPMNYGGPYLGFLCSTKALMRKMPGRIVGATTDDAGQRVFVLTLQAREQHIRREKATSNICSNQGLMALYATIYLSVMGNAGLRKINDTGNAGAHYLCRQLESTGRMVQAFPDGVFVNEFAMKAVDINLDALMEKCVECGILPGVRISEDMLLIAVTEMQTKAQMDKLVEIVRNLENPENHACHEPRTI